MIPVPFRDVLPGDDIWTDGEWRRVHTSTPLGGDLYETTIGSMTIAGMRGDAAFERRTVVAVPHDDLVIGDVVWLPVPSPVVAIDREEGCTLLLDAAFRPHHLDGPDLITVTVPRPLAALADGR